MTERWFTERCAEAGTAFSLAVTETLADERTAYQRIEVFETTHFGRLMVIDGFIMLSGRDNFIYHEMMAHPPLYAHAGPQRVAIIGGGDCGTLREVAKHAEVTEIVQVEIDGRVTALAEQFFPELCTANADPRVTLLFEDGIKWMAARAPESLDVIIVDSTDPLGPAEGLFGESFHRDCRRCLASGGLFVQQSESPLLHLETIIRPVHHSLRAAGFLDTLTYQFPQPVYPSGWWTATMASKDGLLTGFREEAVEEKPFETRYYNAAVHRGAMATPEFMWKALLG